MSDEGEVRRRRRKEGNVEFCGVELWNFAPIL